MIFGNRKEWRGHPLQEKVGKGEVQLIDHLDIPENEFLAKIAILEPEEQEVAIWARQKREINIAETMLLSERSLAESWGT